MTHPIRTPAGRYLGRKPFKADPKDHLFGVVHAHALAIPLPASVDLSSHLPACFDQGDLGSCGPNAGDGLMCFLFPEIAATGFSRLQIYYDVRRMEGDVGEDGGVQTRDVLKTLQQTGAAPESDWPYDIAQFTEKPSEQSYIDAAKYKIRRFARLVGAQEYMACLAQGHPFLLGIECFESIDSDQLAKFGVMPNPDLAKDQSVGGHDVLCVGYDQNFKQSEVFKASGVDPALVDDLAFKIRNSWGTSWGVDAGHFWLSKSYACSSTAGNDAWTGRL